MNWLAWIAMVAGGLVIATLGLSRYGGMRWRVYVQTLTTRLESGRLPATPQHYDVRELEGLPLPVQDYFRAVLKDGQRIITAATVGLAGRFNMSSSGEQWKPFTSTQRVIVRRPGFLWDAQIRLAPGLMVRVVDGYVAGQGQLRAAVLGLFTVAQLQGDGEIARGELMRYLAEMPWYPTALLPSQGLRWQAVDPRRANATLVDGPVTLTLLFCFNETGLIDSVRAEARGAMVGQEMVMMPWEGRWSHYQVRGGMTVPGTAEVAWLAPQGRKSYFVGNVTSLVYEFSS